MLAWSLTLVLTLSFAFLASFALLGMSHRQAGAIKAAYVAACSALLALIFWWYTGLDHQHVRRKALRMEFRGVEVTMPESSGSRAFVNVTGDPIGSDSLSRHGFQWTALSPGAVLDIKPTLGGERVGSYKAQARGTSAIIRLNGRCVNRAPGGWFPTGKLQQVSNRDGTTFTLEGDGDQVSVKSGFDSNTKSVELRDHLPLADLLDQAGAKNLLNRLKRLSDSRGKPLTESTTVARKDLDDTGSAVGLIWNPGFSSDEVHLSVANPLDDIPVEIGPDDGIFTLRAGSAGLTLPVRADLIAGGAARLQFHFLPARAYGIPSDEVLNASDRRLVLSSTNVALDSSGYLFDTGNSNYPVLKSAWLSPDLSRIEFPQQNPAGNSGHNPQVAVNQETVLGDSAVNPIFVLADPVSAARFDWILPCLCLLLGGFLCAAGQLNPGERTSAKIDRTYALPALWVGACTLLVVRAILSYRVTMMPPGDLSSVAALSYSRSWPWSRAVLEAAPVLLGLAVALCSRIAEGNVGRRAQQQMDALKLRFDPLENKLPRGEDLAGVIFAGAFLLELMVLLFRHANILSAVLLFSYGFMCLGFTRDQSEPLVRDQAKSDSRAQRAWLWWKRYGVLVAGLGMIFAHRGASLFAIGFLVAFCVTLELGRNLSGQRGRAGRQIFGIAAVVPLGIALVLLALPLIQGPLAGLGAAVVKHPVGGDTFYRLAAGSPDRALTLLSDPSTSGTGFDPKNLVDTLLQRWQMIGYVQGSGVGYFRAPFANVGMTYPTILSDACFSSVLVSEHGKFAGWAVIGFHVLIATCLFLGAWITAQTRFQKGAVLALYSFGGLFGFVAIYMALANEWAVPFTGENLPLLSLDSRQDTVLYLGIAFLSVFLFAFPRSDPRRSDPVAETRILSNRLTWWAFPAAIAFSWLVVLPIVLAETRGDPKTPFNYSPAIYDRLKEAVASAQTEVEHAPDQGNLSLASTSVFRSSSRWFQEQAIQFDRGSLTHTAIVQEPGQTRAFDVDTQRLASQSPWVVDDGVAWHGSLVAERSTKEHELMISGKPSRFILRPGAGNVRLTLGRAFVADSAQRIEFGTGANYRTQSNYGGIELTDDGRVIVQWNDTNKPAEVLVNGARQSLSEHVYEMKPADLVTLRFRGSESDDAGVTVAYLGQADQMLTRVLWRNGKYVRIYPQGADFPLAFSIAAAGDAQARGRSQPPAKVGISIDLSLQRRLQGSLRSWGIKEHRLVNSGGKSADGLPFTAACVLDSFTGQVRALASIPQLDPTGDPQRIDLGFSRESEAYQASRSSWALVNRTIGSTVKPLTFCALASALRGKGFDLGNLTVSEQAGIAKADDGTDRYCKLGDLKLGRGVAEIQHPRASVSMFEYLRDSRTWPAVVTETLGLRHGEGAPWNMMSGSGHDVAYQTKWHGLNPRRAAGEDLFVGGLTISSQALAETALFKGLPKSYGSQVMSFTSERGRYPSDAMGKFLPFDVSPDSGSEVRRWVLPDPHWADQTLLTNFDDNLIRYMIGGGECRWNAVTMAANAARITTGKTVSATLCGVSPPEAGEMPAPLNNQKWREAHLLNPLSQITTFSAAKDLEAKARAAGLRLVMKTGTIDDGVSGPNSRESEMLMFTLGKYGTNGFVPGHTVSGFVSIRSSKPEHGEMVKSDLLKKLVPIVIAYLGRN